MVGQSKILRLRAKGPMACFTRPELKVERVSYEVITPSAARALFEAVLWKPAIRWSIHEIAVLRPATWINVQRNEVKLFASDRRKHILVEDARTQRSALLLRDVDYVISASFQMTERAGERDNVRKFEEMFERRLTMGQVHQTPYFGCREFAAYLEPAPETFTPIEPDVERRPLGMMFYDFDYRPATPEPHFFPAFLRRGVLSVPPRDEIFGGPS